MADTTPQTTDVPTVQEEPPKTIDVEPAPEGPKVKPKRVLTQNQLEALRKGRERLAEIRRAAKEEETMALAEASTEVPVNGNEYESSQQDSWCSIM
jgi:hypothetical protein